MDEGESDIKPIEINNLSAGLDFEDDSKINKVGQEQIHGLLFSDKLSWQAIIYDLINAEQLDPWDIDLVLLTNKFLEKIKNLEEANFFVSSKVLLAAALLLRIKSEMLLDRDIKSLDDILYGKKEEKKYVQERIELEEEVPSLVPRTPLPRFRKVTLEELMRALGKAINTENRRIRRLVIAKRHEFEATIGLPKHRINLRDQIKGIYEQLLRIFSNREEKLAFSEIWGKSSEEKISAFVPLLHLDSQHKIWLEQDGHLEEIWILLKNLYEKQNREKLEKMRREAEEATKNFARELSKEELERAEKLETEFKEPLGED